MLVSWQWLNDYVALSVTPDELADRFAMSGLNHEQTLREGDDTVLDLEVTSNRGDCLGHIGVAREAAVLLEQPLCLPEPRPQESSAPTNQSVQIENLFPESCTRYTARVIRGVRIGPSPEWLVKRLKSIGIKSINNVVDVTNYVMMECGQPLHAFDLQHIRGNKIMIRPAMEGEEFMAIDHKTYILDAQTVVIADAQRALALGGVMGGADSEISDSTTDVLLESALFQPLAIRRAARRLKLHSPSSFRFERRPDPVGVDWASLRCCELILQVAGGSLESGVVSVGQTSTVRPSIPFRSSQIERLLGIEIPDDRVGSILQNLGCQVVGRSHGHAEVVPPSWRGDLSREVDLIEEVARIHGYDRIPENVSVPMSVVQPRRKDIAVGRIRHTLSAFGIDEAMTASVVTEKMESCGSLWSANAPLATETPLLEGARLLRRSITPSLLAARQSNQTQFIRNAQLYEIANVVLPEPEMVRLPHELTVLGIVTAGDLFLIKGVVQKICQQLGRDHLVQWKDFEHELFASGSAQRLEIQDRTIGFLGVIHPSIQQRFDLDAACCAAELDIDVLTSMLVEIRESSPFSMFPAVVRDLNFIVDESLRWVDLENACRRTGGADLSSVEYRETYRDAKKDGPNKKRILLSLHYQSMEKTLTGEQVDSAVASVVSACQKELGAALLG